MAEVVGRALDAYLTEYQDPTRALAATFGAVPNAAVPERDEGSRG